MPRLWLALVLLVLAIPAPLAAQACEVAPERHDVAASDDHHDGRGIARAADGVELVQTAPTRKKGTGPLPGRPPLPIASLPTHAADETPPAADEPCGCPPLCERLPYDLTAPPSPL